MPKPAKGIGPDSFRYGCHL